jgi:hypothetical protein
MRRNRRVILGADGVLLGTAEYVRGMLDGSATLVGPSGGVTQEANYRGGELHGLYRAWWENGRIKEEGTYRSGNRVGIYRCYLPDGSVEREYDYGARLSSATSEPLRLAIFARHRTAGSGEPSRASPPYAGSGHVPAIRV